MKKIILVLALIASCFASTAQMQRIKESNSATFAIDFLNTQIGALSHYDTLFTTVDFGNTWINKLRVNGQIEQIKYGSSNVLFASAITYNNGPYDLWIYKSLNNGITWDSILVNTPAVGLRNIALRNNNEVAHYDVSNDTFLISNFLTHTVSSHIIQNGMQIKKMQFVSSDTAIALLTELIDTVNYLGNVTLKKTMDGGNTWDSVWTAYANISNAQTHFADAAHGVIRVDTVFYYTADGGMNWTSMSAGVAMNFNETLQMISPTVAYCIHDNGLLRLQLDNLTFINSALDSISYIHSWCFADFIDDNNWIIAENLLSCGIYGSNIWKNGINDNNPNEVPAASTSQHSILIFPNPCKGYLTLTFTKLRNEFVEVRMINLNGEILHKSKISESGTQLNLSSYANGCYFLKFNIGKDSFTKMIVLEK